MTYLALFLSLGIILLGAEIFTNSVEWLGKKLRLGEAAIGSILAAIGTALPETMISLIAIIFGTSKESLHIGIGTILGAPLMLATLAMFITGVAAVVYKVNGKTRKYMFCNTSIIKKDLGFFLLVYSIALGTSLLHLQQIKLSVALILVLIYVYYAYQTIKSGEKLSKEKLIPLLFNRGNRNPSLNIILLQTIVALSVIVFGAHTFVKAISQIAIDLQIPALVLSIIITPIATELPEKFNSVVWVKQGKDTLALGNITGAMVFQSSIVPAIGILLTPWQLSFLALTSGILALCSAGILYYALSINKKLKPQTLIKVGCLYLIFFILVIYTKP